jgi:hypothetical protein
VHNLVCHAFCLIGNHYHLLLETPDGNLSAAMRDINGVYTQKFNKRHNRSGHLFQARFKAFLIEKELYFLAVGRYIVLNPVVARVVRDPKNWKWSSYRATAGYVSAPDWLDINSTLGLFSKRSIVAKQKYREYIHGGDESVNPYDELEEGFILGSPQFVYSVWKKTDGSEEIKDYPRSQRVVGRMSIEEIFDDVESVAERDKTIVFARERCGYLISEIAKHLGLDNSTVGKIARGKYHNKNLRKK